MSSFNPCMPLARLVLTQLPCRRPHAVTDDEDGLFVMLVGRPEDSDWNMMIAAFVDAMLAAGRILSQREAAASHRRGAHYTIGDGISFGGGRVASASFASAFIQLTVLLRSALATFTCQL